MTSGSACSKASASDRVTAVIMLTQSICTGVIGSAVAQQDRDQHHASASPPLVGRMNMIDLRMLS